jgi:hypothetical protein
MPCIGQAPATTFQSNASPIHPIHPTLAICVGYVRRRKFLFTIDRDPELVERYREDPHGTVTWWEAERANVILNLPEIERSTWQQFTDEEREALATHDYVKLLELGAHNFLTLTLFIALFERDYAEPLGFQREYARRLQHWSLPYPDITT